MLPNLQSIKTKLSRINLFFCAWIYLLAFLGFEFLVEDPIRHYNFCVFLSLSGIYFSWVIGGRRTMYYVAFFNIFFVVIFSKLLWNQGIIIHKGLFLSKSFVTLYIFTLLLAVLIIAKKSPADVRMEKQKKAVDEARQHRENLEYMVASRKLKQDLIAQANMVKDELQLIEGAWQSKIHDIINDLPAVKEKELYRQIIVPFQDNIIKHLRDLESGLTFDLKHVRLSELFEFVSGKIRNNKMLGSYEAGLVIQESGWQESFDMALVDRNKLWDIIINILRNSQAALDLKRINMLRSGSKENFLPRIIVSFNRSEDSAELKIMDNGGGVSPEQVKLLYREPVPSLKRGGKKPGQGTLFVKFFSERMEMDVRAENSMERGEEGLEVMIKIPLYAVSLNDSE